MEHSYLLSDLIFVVIVCFIAIFTPKGSYKQSNGLLAGQFMLTLGFSTLVISLDMYDGLYFDAYMMLIYCLFYHLITKTGCRYLGQLSLIIAGYHFARFFGEIINIELDNFLAYGWVMNGFMLGQVMLALGGLISGHHARLVNYNRWRSHYLGDKK